MHIFHFSSTKPHLSACTLPLPARTVRVGTPYLAKQAHVFRGGVQPAWSEPRPTHNSKRLLAAKIGRALPCYVLEAGQRACCQGITMPTPRDPDRQEIDKY
eukprot:1159924-Pelagomonas_calceolata.AAC.12